MTRLALDTALGLSLALETQGKTYAYSSPVARSSDLLPTELQNIFTESNTTATQLTHIFVTTGPGSFTGIRLGLATAEALKLVNPALKIIGLSTLQALALQILTENNLSTNITLALDAAGQQAYTQTFTSTAEPASEALCIPLHEIQPSPNLYATSSLLLDAKPVPTLNPQILLELAANSGNHLPATPVYIKPLTYKMVNQ